MAEFLNKAQREDLASKLLDLHDTFGREIVVYKEAKKVIISTDPSYNHLYNSAGQTTPSVKNVPERKVFKARIRYDTDRTLENFGETDAQIKTTRVDPSSLVRIKLLKEDFNYIKDAKRIELDGRMFHIASDARAHGLFDVVQFFTIFLRPLEQ